MQKLPWGAHLPVVARTLNLPRLSRAVRRRAPELLRWQQPQPTRPDVALPMFSRHPPYSVGPLMGCRLGPSARTIIPKVHSQRLVIVSQFSALPPDHRAEFERRRPNPVPLGRPRDRVCWRYLTRITGASASLEPSPCHLHCRPAKMRLTWGPPPCPIILSLSITFKRRMPGQFRRFSRHYSKSPTSWDKILLGGLSAHDPWECKSFSNSHNLAR